VNCEGAERRTISRESLRHLHAAALADAGARRLPQGERCRITADLHADLLQQLICVCLNREQLLLGERCVRRQLPGNEGRRGWCLRPARLTGRARIRAGASGRGQI
jgi:hypothetical protein